MPILWYTSKNRRRKRAGDLPLAPYARRWGNAYFLLRGRRKHLRLRKWGERNAQGQSPWPAARRSHRNGSKILYKLNLTPECQIRRPSGCIFLLFVVVEDFGLFFASCLMTTFGLFFGGYGGDLRATFLFDFALKYIKFLYKSSPISAKQFVKKLC